MKMNKRLLTFMLLGLSISLVACGGDSDSDDGKNAKGILIVPIATAKVSAKVLQQADGVKFKEECPNVPAGYTPLKNIKVEFVNKSGQSVDDTTTDKCGEFSATVPDEVVQVKAKSAGNKDLVTDVNIFQSTGSTGIASTISSNAEYQISSMQMTSDDKLAFSVTDSVSNNAVIGIPNSALTAKINTQAVTLSQVSSAANIADPASITLVMDASGSMSDPVFDKGGNSLVDSEGNLLDRFRIAHLAASTYLDNMPKTDESAFIIFSSRVDFMNDEKIEQLFPRMLDSADNATTYKFSINGYTKEASKLRFIVDAFNPYSTLYSLSNFDKKHADTPDVKLGRYPWRGSTSLYDAANEAIENNSARTNSRKLLILMSDGEDTRSSSRESDVISNAIDKATPIHTIAFGGGSDAQTLKNIADQTNASFFKAEGQNLVGAFRSIQTSITFQYLANLGKSSKTGDIIELTLNYNGIKVVRNITR